MTKKKSIEHINAQRESYDHPVDGEAYVRFKGGQYTIITTEFLKIKQQRFRRLDV